MPQGKDLKRRVRERMQKTGEPYTTARAKLLDKRHPVPANHARLAGMSDAAVRAKTGKTWRQWVRVLDEVDAGSQRHREIAAYLHEHHDLPGWWAQMVTVGYERIRGLRDVGQRRGGGYEASKSKTVAAPVSRLFRAWGDGRTRRRWLPDDLEVRTTTRNKSIRITWGDGSSVECWFTAKGNRKSQVVVQHRKLPDKATAARMKDYWAGRLEALADLLIE